MTDAPAIVRSCPLSAAAAAQAPGPRDLAVAFIGAGNYAGRVLIPAFRASGARLVAVATANGINAARYGRRNGFELVSTDVEAVLAQPEVDLVVIATRHDTHAQFVQRALAAGKHVFVEKPLALTTTEVDTIEAALAPGEQPRECSWLASIAASRRCAANEDTAGRGA